MGSFRNKKRKFIFSGASGTNCVVQTNYNAINETHYYCMNLREIHDIKSSQKEIGMTDTQDVGVWRIKKLK